MAWHDRKRTATKYECRQCGEMKPKSDFQVDRGYVRHKCRECTRRPGVKPRYKRTVTDTEVECVNCREMFPKSEFNVVYIRKDLTPAYNSYCPECTRVINRHLHAKRLNCKTRFPRLYTKTEIECVQCHYLKPFEQFSRKGGSLDSKCKPCNNLNRRTKYRKDRK